MEPPLISSWPSSALLPSSRTHAVTSTTSYPAEVEELVDGTCNSPWEKFFLHLFKMRLLNPDLTPIGKSLAKQLHSMKDTEIGRLRKAFHEPREFVTRDGLFRFPYTIASFINEIRIILKNHPNLKIIQIILTGSAVYKVLGWSYFCDFLTSIGVDLNAIPKEVLSSLQSEFLKNSGDIDLRLLIPDGSLQDRKFIITAISHWAASKLHTKYPADFESYEAAQKYAAEKAFSNICNLPFPYDYFVQGMSNNFDFNLDVIWEKSIYRQHLFIFDALRIIVPEEILSEEPLLTKIVPQSDYPYPFRVLFDKCGRVCKADNILSVNKFGHPRSALNGVKGVCSSTLEDEKLLVANFVGEIPAKTQNKAEYFYNLYNDVLRGHEGSRPSVRIPFTFSILSILLRHLKHLKKNEYTIEDLEFVRFKLLKGLLATAHDMSELQKSLLCILADPNLSVREACTFIQNILLLAFLVKPGATKNLALYYDPHRSMDFIQVYVKGQNEEQTTLAIPLNALNDFQVLMERKTCFTNSYCIDFYSQLMHERVINPASAPKFNSESFLGQLHQIAVKLKSASESMLKALAFRVGLLEGCFKSALYYPRDLLLEFPAVYAFERGLHCHSLPSSMEQAFRVPMSLDKAASSDIKLCWIEALIGSQNPGHSSIALELLKGDPSLWTSESLESLCVAWIKSAAPEQAVRLWKAFQGTMTREAQDRVMLVVCEYMLDRQRNSQFTLMDFPFLCAEICSRLERQGSQEKHSLVWVKMQGLILQNNYVSQAFKLLYLLTDAHHFKEVPQEIIEGWISLAKYQSILMEGGLRFLVSIAFTSDIREKGNLVCRLLDFCCKSLQECQDKGIEFPPALSYLFREVLERACHYPLDPKIHSQIIQLLLTIFFKYTFAFKILSSNQLNLLAKAITTQINLIRIQGVKLSKQAEELFSSGCNHALTFLRQFNQSSNVLQIGYALLQILPSGINQDQVWDHAFWAVECQGGFNVMPYAVLTSVVQMIETALKSSPTAAFLRRPQTSQAIQTCILRSIPGVDRDLIVKWEGNIEAISGLQSEEVQRKMWLEIIDARIGKKQFEEAGRIFLNRSALFLPVLPSVHIKIISLIESIIKRNLKGSLAISIDLLSSYRVADQGLWDRVLHLCAKSKDPEVHLKAWKAFWDCAIPRNIIRKGIKLSSCLIPVLYGGAQSHLPCMLELLDKEEEVRRIAVNDHFRHAITLILKGCLKGIRNPEEAQTHSSKLLHWRGQLEVLRPGNYRSIDTSMIHHFCSVRTPELFREACTLCDRMLNYDLSMKRDSCEKHCRAVMTLIKCACSLPNEEEMAPLIQGNVAYLESSPLIKEFFKELVVELFRSRHRSLKEKALKLFLRFFAAPDENYFVEDDSDPFMKVAAEILEMMLKPFDWANLRIAARIFKNPIIMGKIHQKPWSALLCRAVNASLDNVMGNPHGGNLDVALEFFISNIPGILKQNSKHELLVKFANALLSVSGLKFNTLLMYACKQFFDARIDDIYSCKDYQRHPDHSARQVFIKTLVMEAYRNQRKEHYSCITDIVIRFLEIFINTPEELTLMQGYFSILFDFLPMYGRVSVYEYKFMQFTSFYLDLKYGDIRHPDGFCLFDYGSLKADSYLSVLIGYQPEEENLPQDELENLRRCLPVPVEPSEGQFKHPGYVVVTSMPIDPQLEQEAKAVGNYLGYMDVFLNLAIEKKFNNSFMQAYLRDFININISELIKLVSHYFQRKGVQQRTDPLVVRATKIVLNLINKFSLIIPDSMEMYKFHEVMCYLHLVLLNKSELPIEAPVFNEVMMYSSHLAIKNEQFVMAIKEMHQEKWKAVINKTIEALMQNEFLPIMSYRIRKAITILSKFAELGWNKNSREILALQEKVLDRIAANPHLLTGDALNFVILTSIPLVGLQTSTRINIFREQCDRIFNMCIGFIDDPRYLFIKDESSDRDPLGAAINCLRVYQSRGLYVNAWKIYAGHMTTLGEEVVKRFKAGGANMMINFYHNLFELVSFRKLFTKEDTEVIAKAYNYFIRRMVEINRAVLAHDFFRMARSSFFIYNDATKHLEDDMDKLFTNVQAAASNRE